MNDRYQNDDFIKSLIQYLEGTADSAAQKSVKDWLSLDNQNRCFLIKVKKILDNLGELKELTNESVEKDWEILLARIHKEEHSSAGAKKIFRLKKSLLYAAAIILVLVTLLGGYFISQESIKPFNYKMKFTFYNISVPKGKETHILLSDGTKIWINAGSKMKISNKLDGGKREVWLDGEAYFEVAKDPQRPFLVHTSDLTIKVLGTKFNVKAYSDDELIETTLVSGLVSIQKRQENLKTENRVLLKPNHRAVYIKNKGLFNKEKEKKLDESIGKHILEPIKPQTILVSEMIKTESDISWKNGKLIFEDEPFENVAKKLERHYNVHIIIKNQMLKDYHYSGVLKNIPLAAAMEAIQITAKFDYIINNDQVIITKK